MSNLLKFWIQAENFSRNLLNLEAKIKRNNQLLQKNQTSKLYQQWQNDAMIIYDK